MKKEVVICDGCGKIIENPTENRYRLYLKSDRFWNQVDHDFNVVELDFCEKCARDIKSSLEKIAKYKVCDHLEED